MNEELETDKEFSRFLAIMKNEELEKSEEFLRIWNDKLGGLGEIKAEIRNWIKIWLAERRRIRRYFEKEVKWIQNLYIYPFDLFYWQRDYLLSENSTSIIFLIKWNKRIQLFDQNETKWDEFLASFKNYLTIAIERVRIRETNGTNNSQIKIQLKKSTEEIIKWVISHPLDEGDKDYCDQEIMGDVDNFQHKFSAKYLRVYYKDIHAKIKFLRKIMDEIILENNLIFNRRTIVEKGSADLSIFLDNQWVNLIDLFSFYFFYTITRNRPVQNNFKKELLNRSILEKINIESIKIKKNIIEEGKNNLSMVLFYPEQSGLFDFIPNLNTFSEDYERSIKRTYYSSIRYRLDMDYHIDDEGHTTNIIWLDKNLDYIKDFYTGINKERDFILLLANYQKYLNLNAKKWIARKLKYLDTLTLEEEEMKKMMKKASDKFLYESNYLFWCHRKNIIDYLNTDNRIEYENDEEEKERIKRIAYQNRKKIKEKLEKEEGLIFNEWKGTSMKDYYFIDNTTTLPVLTFMFLFYFILWVYLLIISGKLKDKNKKNNTFKA